MEQPATLEITTVEALSHLHPLRPLASRRAKFIKQSQDVEWIVFHRPNAVGNTGVRFAVHRQNGTLTVDGIVVPSVTISPDLRIVLAHLDQFETCRRTRIPEGNQLAVRVNIPVIVRGQERVLSAVRWNGTLYVTRAFLRNAEIMFVAERSVSVVNGPFFSALKRASFVGHSINEITLVPVDAVFFDPVIIADVAS